jgi:hypothetical protein
MRGLGPRIHVFLRNGPKHDVDGRDKHGHDEATVKSRVPTAAEGAGGGAPKRKKADDLDNVPIGIYGRAIPIPPKGRDRCDRSCGSGAAPAGVGSQPRTRAAPGLRPPGHYEPAARSSLTEGAEAPEKRGPGPSRLLTGGAGEAAVERREATRPARGRTRRKAWTGYRCAARRSAPLAREARRKAPLRRADQGGPGAFQTIRAAERWLDGSAADLRYNTQGSKP